MDTPKGEYDLDSSLFRISMVFNINTSTNNDCNRKFGNCLFYARKISDFFLNSSYYVQAKIQFYAIVLYKGLRFLRIAVSGSNDHNDYLSATVVSYDCYICSMHIFHCVRYSSNNTYENNGFRFRYTLHDKYIKIDQDQDNDMKHWHDKQQQFRFRY